MHPITEAALADQLGIPREVVRKNRREKLRAETDWWMQGNAVWLAAGGAELLTRLLTGSTAKKRRPASPANGVTATDDTPAAAAPAALVVMLRIYKLVLNPHLVLATDGRKVFRVRVQSAANFMPGMEIPARHIQSDLYELARACPRRPGKW
jgi:hypothetical protein